jgi:hypothetical protein
MPKGSEVSEWVGIGGVAGQGSADLWQAGIAIYPTSTGNVWGSLFYENTTPKTPSNIACYYQEQYTGGPCYFDGNIFDDYGNSFNLTVQVYTISNNTGTWAYFIMQIGSAVVWCNLWDPAPGACDGQPSWTKLSQCWTDLAAEGNDVTMACPEQFQPDSSTIEWIEEVPATYKGANVGTASFNSVDWISGGLYFTSLVNFVIPVEEDLLAIQGSTLTPSLISGSSSSFTIAYSS